MTPSGRAASPSRAMSPSGLSVSSIKEVPCSPGGLLALHQRLQAREEEKLRWLDARLNGGQAAGEGRKPPSYGRRTSQPTPPGQQQHGATTRVLGSSAAPTELSERLDRSRRVRRSWRDAGDIDAAIVTGLRVALLGRIERDAAAPPGSERALPDRVKAVFVSRSGVCVECAGSSEGGMLLGQLPKDGSGRCCLCGKVPEHPQVAPDGSQDAERRLSMHQVGDASVAAAVALRRVLTQAEGDRAAEWAAWAERISAAEQGKKSVDESPSSETQGVGAEALAISRILAVAVPSPGAWKEVQAAYEGRYGSESGGLRVETERRFEPEELRAVKQAVRRGGAVWSEEELRLAIVARCWSATTDDEAAVVTGVRVALLGHLEREAAAAPGSEGSLPAGLEAAFVARSGVCAECAAGAEGQVLLGELLTEASGRCRACGKVPEPPKGTTEEGAEGAEGAEQTWLRAGDASIAAAVALRRVLTQAEGDRAAEWAAWAERVAGAGHQAEGTGEEAAAERAGQVFDAMDRNKDGQLSHSEIKKYLREHPEVKKQLGVVHWGAFFDRWDADGDGRVQKAEFLKSWVEVTTSAKAKAAAGDAPEPSGVGTEALVISRLLAAVASGDAAWEELQAAYECRYGKESG
eukprot:Hpha_TRINITY_DN16172_c1_g1::TRINITY_DN16172_c1_g1_i12::g.7868::m.7868